MELPSVVEAAGEEAQRKFLEFFLAQISSENTRKAYARATRQFFEWCEERGLKLEEIGPNVAALYVRTVRMQLSSSTSPPCGSYATGSM